VGILVRRAEAFAGRDGGSTLQTYTRSLMRLVAAGVSYRTAPLAVREAAAVSEEQASNLLRYLVGHAGIHGAAVLSTCNRTEFYVVCPDGDATEVAPRLAQYIDPSGERGVGQHLVSRFDSDAVRHMFRVAGGLESMVIGEAQVLGQFKASHRFAREAGTLDARLDFVMRRALSTAKLVRTHTSIGRGAGSLSEVAVDCARSIAGDLHSRGVLLLGAGKMSVLAARRLKELGANIIATSRGESKERLARQVGAETIALSALADAAGRIDVIIASTDSSDTVLDAAAVSAVQQRRGFRPLCIVDLAVPRDVEPSAAQISGVTLIDVDALGRRLDDGIALRREAVPAAEEIIDVELRHTFAVLNQRDTTGPTITALTRRAETLRQREVERTLERVPDADAVIRERVDTLTKSLVRKLLHDPIALLRESTDDPAVALILRQAFGLDDIEVEAPKVDAPKVDAPATEKAACDHP
jgi:glutamyl-tRNA reductase